MKKFLPFILLLVIVSSQANAQKKITPDMWDLARITMYSAADFGKKMDSLGASKHSTNKDGVLTYEFKRNGYKEFFGKKDNQVWYDIVKESDNNTVFFKKLLSDLASYYWGTKGEDGKFYPEKEGKKGKKEVYVFSYLDPVQIIYVVETKGTKESVWVGTKMQ
jgi:hypothetical protein